MAGLPKRRWVPNVDVCDEALGLDPDSAAPPSHREFPLHEAPHILLPYLRCAAEAGASTGDGSDDGRAAPAGGFMPGEELLLPASGEYCARCLHVDSDGPGASFSAERAHAVCRLREDAPEMLSMPTREVPDDAATGGCGSSTKSLLEGFAAARAPVPRELIDEIAAEEAEGAVDEASWDAFAGNGLAVCGTGLLCASGLGLDSLRLLSRGAQSWHALGSHPLPAGRRVRQMCAVPLGEDWLGVARASHWLHFVRVSAEGALSCAGVSTLTSRATHAALNPRVGGEAAAVLEDGHLVTMRFDKGQAGVGRWEAGVLPTVWGDASVVRLPWQGEAWPPPASFRWAAAEWGEHPRLLYVANRAQLFRLDLRAPHSQSLLLDLHEAPWRPRDPLSALATPSGTYGYGGALVAVASSHSLLLFDTRCTRAPQQQWTLPPSPAPWPQPRHWLSFSGRSLHLLERGTGRALAFPTSGSPSPSAGPPSLGQLVTPPPLPRSLDPSRALFRALAADEARTGRVLPLAGGARVSPAELVALGQDGSLYHLAPQPSAEDTAAVPSGDAEGLAAEYPLDHARASAVRAMLSCGVCRGEAGRKVRGGMLSGHTCGLTPAERRARSLLEPRTDATPPAGGSDGLADDYFSGVLRPAADEVTALLGRATQALTQARDAPAPAELHAHREPIQLAEAPADAQAVEAPVSRLSRLWEEWSSSQALEMREAEGAAAPTAFQSGAGTSLDAVLGPNRAITPARASQRPPKQRKRRSSGF